MKTITIEWIEYTLTPVEKKYKRWKAEKWGDYYAIVSNWEIELSQHDNHHINDLRYNIGNYFKIEKEAIKERDKRLAIVRVNDAILSLNEWWKPDWKDGYEEKYSIIYECKYDGFSIANNSYSQRDLSISYMKSEEVAKQIIKEHQEDLKLIFDI